MLNMPIYLLMFCGFVVYLIFLNLKVNSQQDKLEKLQKMGVLKNICQNHQSHFIAIVVMSFVSGLFFMVLGFKVLNFFNVLDFFTGAGWFVFINWLFTLYGSLLVKDMVVKKGALYL